MKKKEKKFHNNLSLDETFNQTMKQSVTQSVSNFLGGMFKGGNTSIAEGS
jgi:hypothetical protein